MKIYFVTNSKQRCQIGVVSLISMFIINLYIFATDYNGLVGRFVNTDSGVTIRHWRMVCFHTQTDYETGNVTLQSYDDSIEEGYSYIPLSISKWNSIKPVYWIIDNQPSSALSRNYTIYNETAIFPYYWRNSNHIFLLWHDILPCLFDQLQFANSVLASKFKSFVLIAPKMNKINVHFQRAIASIGFTKILSFAKISASPNVSCYRNGIVGRAAKTAHRKETVQQLVRQQWQLSNRCDDSYVLFIQRNRTRHIVNIKDLIHTVEQHGSCSTCSVRVESLENLSLRQQATIVNCASMLVAVQGAGLSWYRFLQPGATVIELTWPGWPARYQQRIWSSRHDISARVVKCTAHVPEAVWRKYAKLWYNHSGNITSEWRQKLSQKSLQVRVPESSVWKDSDCVCSRAVFRQALLATVTPYEQVLSRLL